MLQIHAKTKTIIDPSYSQETTNDITRVSNTRDVDMTFWNKIYNSEDFSGQGSFGTRTVATRVETPKGSLSEGHTIQQTQKGATHPDEFVVNETSSSTSSSSSSQYKSEDFSRNVILQIYMLITSLFTNENKHKKNSETGYFWSEAGVHHKYNVAYKSILNNMFVPKKDKDDLEYIFHKTQRNYLALKRFINIYRYKKSEIKINTDLCLNTIDLNNKKNICIILQNNIKYVFTLPDIQNILMTSITHHNSFFPEPHMPRNPYTNMPLTKSDIYNIYFTISESRRITPPLLTECFLNNFDMELFLVNNEAKLRDYSIKDYVTNSPYTILYPEVMYMVRKYFKNTQIIEYCEKIPKSKMKKIIHRNVDVKLMIHPEFPRDVLVDILRPYLYLYILSYDSIDGTEKRTIAHKIFNNQKKKFMKYNYKFGRKHISIVNNTQLSRFLGEIQGQDALSSHNGQRAESLLTTNSGGEFSQMPQITTEVETPIARDTEGDSHEGGRTNEVFYRRDVEGLHPSNQNKSGAPTEVINRQNFNSIHEQFTMFQAEKMLSTKNVIDVNLNNEVSAFVRSENVINSDANYDDAEFMNYYAGEYTVEPDSESTQSSLDERAESLLTTNSGLRPSLFDHRSVASSTSTSDQRRVEPDSVATFGGHPIPLPLSSEDEALLPQSTFVAQPEEFMNNVPPADDILLNTHVTSFLEQLSDLLVNVDQDVQASPGSLGLLCPEQALLAPDTDQRLRMYEESAIQFLSYISDNESTGYDSNS